MKYQKILLSLLLFFSLCNINSLKAIDFVVKGITVEAPYPGEVDEFCQFVENYLAPAGANTLLLRVDYNYKFQTYPAVAQDSALSVTDIKKILAVCRAKRIELIPLMSMLGHQSTAWAPKGLLKAFPQFDETPWVEYATSNSIRDKDGLFPGGLYTKAYCPNHPDVHEVVFALAGELIDAFESKYFCSGLDEVFYVGLCDRCIATGKTKAQIFADEVQRINTFVKGKNNKLIIWGDRLLNAAQWGMGMWDASINETWDAIDMIDKDITILDWHYKKTHLTPVYFALKGFDILSCPGEVPAIAVEQLRNLTVYSKSSQIATLKSRFKGFIITNWGRCSTFMSEFKQEKDGIATNTETTARGFFKMMEELAKITAEETAVPIITKKTIYVSETGDNTNAGTKTAPFQTLNRAINVANSGDTIRVSGTILCSNVLITNNLVLTIIGDGKESTFLQPASTKALSDNRVLSIVNSDTIFIKDLTIRWGNTTRISDAMKNGGNIYIENSIVNLHNVNVVEGTGVRGGGIYINGTRNRTNTKHHFLNTTIADNVSTAGSGGGIFLTANKWNENRTLIEQCLITNNMAQLKNTTGGGIYLEPFIIDQRLGTGKKCALTIVNSTIFNNTATKGAGMATGYVDYDATITLVNNTIAFNNGTAQDNTGAGSGGISVQVTPKIAFTLINNLICMNTGLRWGQTQSEIHDMYLDGVTVTQADNNAFTNELPKEKLKYALKVPTGNIYLDNSFIKLSSELRNNGGLTRTLILEDNSIAINSGIVHTLNKTDQRGFNRDSQPDIGAFEFGATTSGLISTKKNDIYYSSEEKTLFIQHASTVSDISVFDINGKLVLKKNKNLHNTIQLPNLSKGQTYVVEVLNDAQKEILKFIY